MDDLISRDEAIRALMNSELGSWNNDDYERGTRAQHLYDIAAIKSVPSVRRKRKPSVQPDLPDTNVGDMISRQAAIDACHNYDDGKDAYAYGFVVEERLKGLPPAQPERLTDDDFETIRIHLNAYKEKLCNQRRWKEAEEYQRIIDRFMAFASVQPDLDEWCTDCKEYDQERHCCPRFNRVIRETVEEVRKNAEPGWIPVEDEPSKERRSYWVCTDTGYQCECRWTNNIYGLRESDKWGWSIFDIPQYSKVVAYMPLPKPYERSEE